MVTRDMLGSGECLLSDGNKSHLSRAGIAAVCAACQSTSLALRNSCCAMSSVLCCQLVDLIVAAVSDACTTTTAAPFTAALLQAVLSATGACRSDAESWPMHGKLHALLLHMT